MSPESLLVNSVDGMRRLAERVARGLAPGDVLLLSGELGSGKTTFVQGLAQALGVVDSITSPTFTIVGEYEAENQEGIKKLIHVDLYRLADRAAARETAIAEVLALSGEDSRVTVIEWADRLGEVWPKQARAIAFRHGATADSRLVTLEL